MNFHFEPLLVAAVFVAGALWLVGSLRRRSLGAERKPSGWVAQSRSYFLMLLAVLLVRSFVVEPFHIPSGSMFPTLLIGDFVFTNKFDYGLRLPLLRSKILPIGEPQRGDVVVFHYPEKSALTFCAENPVCFEQLGMREVRQSRGEDYIKRVIGLPGDVIRYQGNQLWINGTPVRHVLLGPYQGSGPDKMPAGTERWMEYLPIGHGKFMKHEILTIPGTAENLPSGTIKVPPGHYFMMGDDRDNSFDSRYWGPVPSRDLVGKAFLIWFNWAFKDNSIDLHRIGRVI